jgi:hypothetical protein
MLMNESWMGTGAREKVYAEKKEDGYKTTGQRVTEGV